MEPNPTIDREKALKARVEAEAQKRANREPLPGPLAAAFSPRQDIQVGAFTVRPFVAMDFALLRDLDNPLYKQLLEGKDEKVTPQPEELFELCYLFTRPCKESRDLIRKGRDVFRDAAVDQFGYLQYDDPTTMDIFGAILQHMGLSTSTMLEHSAKEEKSEETFFPASTVVPPTA